MNIQKIKQAAEIAKTRTNDKRWLAAIDKAVAGVESGWIVTELHDHILVTTENGTYHANGACQCKAYTEGGKQACKHRALYRLIQIAAEIETAAPAVSRAQLIADIKAAWPKACPGVPLYTALLARFGKSHLEMLDTETLRDIRLAISM